MIVQNRAQEAKQVVQKLPCQLVCVHSSSTQPEAIVRPKAQTLSDEDLVSPVLDFVSDPNQLKYFWNPVTYKYEALQSLSLWNWP